MLSAALLPSACSAAGRAWAWDKDRDGESGGTPSLHSLNALSEFLNERKKKYIKSNEPQFGSAVAQKQKLGKAQSASCF